MLKQDRAAVQFGKLKLTGFAVFHAVQIARYLSENLKLDAIGPLLDFKLLQFTIQKS